MVKVKVVGKDCEVRFFEYTSVEAAIAGLGKLVGIAPTEKAPRKSRNDAGQPRGPNARTAENAAGANAGAAGTSTAGNSTTGTTDPSKVDSSTNSTSTTPNASASAPATTAPAAATTAPVAPQAAAPSSGNSTSAGPQVAPAAQTAPSTGAAAPTKDDVQAAVEKIFGNVKLGGYENTSLLLSRYGVKRGQDLPEDKRADFIARVDRVLAGEAI